MAVNFLTSLILTSLIMSVLILCLFILMSGLTRVTTAKTRYFIWIVVFVGLAIPFRPIVGSGLVTIHPPSGQNNLTLVNSSEAAHLQESAEDSSLPKEKADRTPLPVGMIVFWIWAVGAVAVFAWHIGKYCRFRKTVSRWSSVVSDENILNVLDILKAQRGLTGKRIDLFKCDCIASPMLTGFIRPTILLPDKEIDRDELKLILDHELMHYKHNDLLVKLLGIIVTSIHWFNPIVYLCCSASQEDVEAYCDEAVLGNADTNGRRYYGEVIIGMIEKKGKIETVLSTGFYSGKFNMKRRLYAIMDTNQQRKIVSPLAMALVVVLTVSSGSLVAFAKTDKDTLIGLEKAKAIATKHAGVKASECTFIQAKLDRDDGNREYDIEFYYNNTEYDYEINATTGKILKYDNDVEHYTINKNKKSVKAASKPKEVITEEKAKSIVLEDAGLKEADVTFVKMKLDYDDGRNVYDIEFYSGKTEYEYEVDAANGKILEFDQDHNS